MSIIDQLNEVLESRKKQHPKESYVSSLYAAGTDKILQKIGEEATEVVIAGKEASSDPSAKPALVGEVADLWFHSMVLLCHLDLSANDVLEELNNRFGVGGHDEKAQRS